MTTAKMITGPQLTKLHTLLSQLGQLDFKKELVKIYTQGRTESSRELTMEEARDLISKLSANDPRQGHIKAIWMLAYTAGIIYGDSAEDNQMNAAKLNLFLRQRGAVKKDLQSMNLDEMKKVHRQFEAIVKNSQKTADNKQAKAATDKLLAELNIPTLSK